jgi:CBS domain containing-hemolysin-like protein
MASEEPSPRQRGRFLAKLMRRNRPHRKPVEGEAPTDIVDSAEAFKLLRVADLMTPRADIVAVEQSTPFGELLGEFVESEHSRMPVYRETLDDPVGVVHVKDVFKLVAGEVGRPEANEQVLPRLKRPLLYVPPSMPASALLAKMQASRIHMAVVIDEFGGADGLVTLEDLLEAVVGDIDDEHDETSRVRVLVRGMGLYEADARVSLEDLNETVGEDLTPPDLEEDIDTVGGLVSALAGRVPQRGEVVSHPAGYDFEVVDADPRRVRRVRVRQTRGEAAVGES